jgi:hypothetical protein
VEKWRYIIGQVVAGAPLKSDDDNILVASFNDTPFLRASVLGMVRPPPTLCQASTPSGYSWGRMPRLRTLVWYLREISGGGSDDGTEFTY